MKKIIYEKKLLIICITLVFAVNVSYAQFDKNNAVYSTCELNLGNYFGFDLNLNYVYKEKYSFKMGYTGNVRKPKSMPTDYTHGLATMLIWWIASPYDQIENYQICFGKIYELNKNGKIRANLSVGFGYTTIKEPTNWQKIDKAVFKENYTWDYSKHHTASLIINPKIEFPFNRIYGLTVSLLLQVNKDRTYFGIGVGSMIGLLRKKKINNQNYNNE